MTKWWCNKYKLEVKKGKAHNWCICGTNCPHLRMEVNITKRRDYDTRKNSKNR